MVASTPAHVGPPGRGDAGSRCAATVGSALSVGTSTEILAGGAVAGEAAVVVGAAVVSGAAVVGATVVVGAGGSAGSAGAASLGSGAGASVVVGAVGVASPTEITAAAPRPLLEVWESFVPLPSCPLVQSRFACKQLEMKVSMTDWFQPFIQSPCSVEPPAAPSSELRYQPRVEALPGSNWNEKLISGSGTG